MMDASAPHTFTLTDGNEYHFAPLTMVIWLPFCRWLNGMEGRPPNKPVPFDEMLDGAQTADGMIWLLHRSLVDHHKDIKPDEVAALVGNLHRMSEIFTAISDLPEGEEAGSDPISLPMKSTG
jgi:hypothetical protein